MQHTTLCLSICLTLTKRFFNRLITMPQQPYMTWVEFSCNKQFVTENCKNQHHHQHDDHHHYQCHVHDAYQLLQLFYNNNNNDKKKKTTTTTLTRIYMQRTTCENTRMFIRNMPPKGHKARAVGIVVVVNVVATIAWDL